jgi:hypothetical protein
MPTENALTVELAAWWLPVRCSEEASVLKYDKGDEETYTSVYDRRDDDSNSEYDSDYDSDFRVQPGWC